MSTLNELPAVAKNVYVVCKKCDAERYHKVIAHLDSKRAKLECEVCHSKKTVTIGAPKKKTVRKTTKKSSNPAQVWLSLKESSDISQAKPYNMKSRFDDKSVIDHPKFGLGFVTATQAQSIEVHFEDGPRSLVHNRPS